MKGELGALTTHDQSQISLTCKNYRTKTGLATRIHATELEEESLKMTARLETHDDLVSAENFFYIKGPMGKGLQV